MEVNRQCNGAFVSTSLDSCSNGGDENTFTAESIEEMKKTIEFFEQLKPTTNSLEQKDIQVPDKKNCDVPLDSKLNQSSKVVLEFSIKSDHIPEKNFPFDTCDVKTELLDDVKPPDSVFLSEYIIKDEEFSCDDMVEDDEDFYNDDKYRIETNWEEPVGPLDHSEKSNPIDLLTNQIPIVRLAKLPRSIVNTVSKMRHWDVSSSGRILDHVQLYCYKCKKMEKEHVKISKSKNCKTCSKPLIYICTKCNEKCYLNYGPMLTHWKSCKSKQTSNNILNAIVMYHCSDCNYKTLRELSMALHMSRTGHYSKDADEMIHGVNVFDKAECTVAETKIDFCFVVKRYCSKCKRTIAKASSTLIDAKCWLCDGRLVYICTCCNTVCNSIVSMRYHLRTKCFPNFYKCNKCSYTATYWPIMVVHMKSQHTERPDFNCAHCSFKTKYKHLLIKHLVSKHAGMMKMYNCEICCECRTDDKKQLKNHVLQVHFS